MKVVQANRKVLSHLDRGDRGWVICRLFAAGTANFPPARPVSIKAALETT